MPPLPRVDSRIVGRERLCEPGQNCPADRRQPCFLLGDGAEISYRDLELGAARAASLIQAKGVKPGDRVLVRAPKTSDVVMISESQ